jgi:hypothetical protein
VNSEIKGARVEWYSGYRAEEAPRAVIIDGVRLEVAGILLRKRVLDRPGGRIGESWRCRLEDGRVVTVELLEGGSCRVSAAA